VFEEVVEGWAEERSRKRAGMLEESSIVEIAGGSCIHPVQSDSTINTATQQLAC